MKIEMHVHSMHSNDCDLRIEEIVEVARQRGIDAVCITDHDTFEATNRDAIRASRMLDFPVFTGAEYSSSDGHILIYGISDDKIFQEDMLPMQEVINRVNSIGGVAIPAHPYLDHYSHYLGDGVHKLKGLVALETINRRLDCERNGLAESACASMGLKGIGGSDTHYASNLGKVFTEFDANIKNIKELVRELREGNYRPVDLRKEQLNRIQRSSYPPHQSIS